MITGKHQRSAKRLLSRDIQNGCLAWKRCPCWRKAPFLLGTQMLPNGWRIPKTIFSVWINLNNKTINEGFRQGNHLMMEIKLKQFSTRNNWSKRAKVPLLKKGALARWDLKLTFRSWDTSHPFQDQAGHLMNRQARLFDYQSRGYQIRAWKV